MEKINMIEKIESDIEILKNLIANLEIDIATIEKQLEIRELTTNGNDNYFKWRASAVASASFKKVRILAIEKQLSYWQLKLNSLKKKERREAHDKRLEYKKARLKAHDKRLAEAAKRKEIREKEKTERHRINQEQNQMIFDEFKKLVKERLGLANYVDLIEKARISVESGLYDSYGE
jgi:hypothetical protein